MYGQTANMVQLVMPQNDGFFWGSVISPTDAYTIDSKYDDGRADMGSILTAGGYDGSSYTTTCVDSGTQFVAPGQYITPNAKVLCAMAFVMH